MHTDQRPALTDQDRLTELFLSALLDSPVEESFDRITRLTQRVLDVDVAMISLVDDERQFFKSQAGLSEPFAEERQSPLSHSFCQYAVASGQRFVISDARDSELVRDNLAVEEMGVMAYAGEPLETSRGNVLGTLCVIDNEPREWSHTELELLAELTALAMTEIEYRLRTRELQEVETLTRRLQEPIDQLGDAVRSVGSLTDAGDDPRLARLGALARSRLSTVDVVAQDLLRTIASDRKKVEPVFVAVDLGERLLRAQRLASAAVRSVDIRVEVRDRPLSVRCDSYRMERALSQLLVSAMNHAGGDEPVTVILRGEEGVACLDVRTSGRAMPVADLARLLSRFNEALNGSRSDEDLSEASITTRRGLTKATHGPITATTGPEGTHVQAEVTCVG
jgi:GAF domain-containing protein